MLIGVGNHSYPKLKVRDMKEIPGQSKISFTAATVGLGAMITMALAPAALLAYFMQKQAQQQHDNTRGL